MLVSDPVADPNGMAIPILGWPRMVLWTSPPGPESVIGHYTDWARAARRPRGGPPRPPAAAVAQPAAPAARRGRAREPHRARRAALGRRGLRHRRRGTAHRLRTAQRRPARRHPPALGPGWQAAELRLARLRLRILARRRPWPTSSGSAYLEWLEERAGPGSLRNLWARMTARRARSFDEAFEGVFGDSPADLYDRFRAEMTWRALEAERRIGRDRGGRALAGPLLERGRSRPVPRRQAPRDRPRSAGASGPARGLVDGARRGGREGVGGGAPASSSSATPRTCPPCAPARCRASPSTP